jgi:signal transduction histidine kinase
MPPEKDASMKERHSTMNKIPCSPGSTVGILLIEDNMTDALFVREILKEIEGTTFVIEHIDRLSKTLECISEEDFDIILCDLGLPDSDGLDTLRMIIRHAPSTPVVVLTGHDHEDLGIMALQAGAQDYLVKGKITSDLLARCLRYAIERSQLQMKTDLMREEFLAMLTHDLKNPLLAISRSIELVERSASEESSASYLKLFRYIHQAEEVMMSLIKDVIESHRLEAGKADFAPRNFLLRDLTDELRVIFEPQALSFGISINFMIPDEVRVRADYYMIRRVFSNLISNALRHTPEGGSITTEATPACDHVKIRITDTGAGIPECEQRRIFDKFATVKGSLHGSGSTGIGLYLVKSFLQVHGSKIIVESAPEKGTSFFFELPPGTTEAGSPGDAREG